MGWLAELEGGLEMANDFEENTMKPAREFFVKNKDAMAIRAFIDGVVGSPGAFDRFRPEIRSALMNNAREMKAEALSDKLMPKFNEVEAQQISTPVLLLLGSNSPPMFRKIVEALAGSLPNCKLSTIAGASHNLNASRPRVYNDLVLDFIREVEAG